MRVPSINRIWKIVGCLVVSLPLTGCWSRVEINDRAFATMMLVDNGKKEGTVKLSLMFPLPNRLIPSQVGSSGAEGGNPFDVVTKEGENVAIAYRKIQSDLSRKINWGQLRVIVIGEGLAKKGIKPLLEFLAREPDFHLKSYIFIAPADAGKIEDAPAVFERLTSEVIREYAKQRIVVNTSLKDLLVARYYGNDSIISMLTTEKKELVSEKNKTARWIGTDGAALLRDGKMAAKLSTKEMRGALWITDELRDAIISIASPIDGGKISFRVEYAKTKIKPIVDKDKIVFRISSKARGAVISVDSALRPSDSSQHELLAKSLSKEAEDRMLAALNLSKNIGADSFTLGRYLEWNEPQLWKKIKNNWDAVYKEQVEFEVHVLIEVKRNGSISKTPWARWTG